MQVASHQGHHDVVELLISARANLELQDEDGDTALHYSAFGWVWWTVSDQNQCGDAIVKFTVVYWSPCCVTFPFEGQLHSSINAGVP